MSTGLENKLNEILSEKNEKILPENIKRGVTIFGIEGKYRNSIKQYPNVDAMNADTDVEENDLAIIHSSTRTPMDASTVLVNAYFPKIVVLSEVVTETYTITISDPEQTELNTFVITLSPTRMDVYNAFSDGYAYYWESVDGVTYTSPAETNGLYTQLANLSIVDGEWNDLFANFIFSEVYTFGGIYRYAYSWNLLIGTTSDYTGTVTPTEYSTAVNTASEILGEEVSE